MGDCACAINVSEYQHTVIPLSFFVELTPDCNNDCLGCGNVFSEHTSDALSVNEWKNVFDKLPPNTSWLKISGGEPTIHPQFQDIIALIQSNKIPFTIFTNGRWSNADQFISFIKTIPNFKGLLISLHGYDADSHESFTRIAGSFIETVNNIRLAATAGLNISTSTVITRKNWDKVEQIANLSKKLGARQATFNQYIGDYQPEIEPSLEQFRSAINCIEELHKLAAKDISHHPIRFGTPIPQSIIQNSSGKCQAGIAYATIDPWGNIRPCNHAPLLCGNLSQEPFETIWNSEVMMKWRNTHTKRIDIEMKSSSHLDSCLVMSEIRGNNFSQALLFGA